jgi:XTP/dITP diphosphohydrolase
MSRILLATNNPGKLREIQAILQELKAEILTPRQLNLDLVVSETGQTYAENAALKAKAFAQAAGILALADDSGLEVDALDGNPGIHSARFAPWPNASDADRRKVLLEHLRGKPRPWTARFRCTTAIAQPLPTSIEVYFAEGVCEGEIIPEERGANGFGYDPLFLVPQLGKTMAELTMEEKNRLSHRARALRAALPILKELLKS